MATWNPTAGETAASAEQNLDTLAIDLARECLYRFLAAALADPYGTVWSLVQDQENQTLACTAADLLRSEAGTVAERLGFGELSPQRLDLRPLVAELRRPVEELRAEYDRLFGLVLARECPPNETEYHPSSEPFFRSQQLADIAGFYRAFGLDPSSADAERPDHLGLELEFMALLLMKKRLTLASPDEGPEAAERARVCDEAQRNFFREHLAWWVPAFATGLRRKAGHGFYAAAGQVLAALVPAERSRLGVDTPPVPVQPARIERPEEQAGCAGCSAQE
jgi:TorA maturation chaperone TorD